MADSPASMAPPAWAAAWASPSAPTRRTSPGSGPGQRGTARHSKTQCPRCTVCVSFPLVNRVIPEADSTPSASSLGCVRDRQGRRGPDPEASWDVAPSEVASSELTERDLCCTMWTSLDLHRKPDRRSRALYFRAETRHRSIFGCAIPSLFSIGTQVDRPKSVGLRDSQAAFRKRNHCRD
jgi:hypothetical protein